MIALLPATHELAAAVLEGRGPGLPHVADWPHDDTADALRPLAEHPQDCGPGTFLITEDGVVVGDCGWFGPPTDGVAEIGYGVAASVRGRGVGRSAVLLLLEWVSSQGATRVRAEVLPGNAPSLRLLAALAFVDVGEHAGHRVLERHLLG